MLKCELCRLNCRNLRGLNVRIPSPLQTQRSGDTPKKCHGNPCIEPCTPTGGHRAIMGGGQGKHKARTASHPVGRPAGPRWNNGVTSLPAARGRLGVGCESVKIARQATTNPPKGDAICLKKKTTQIKHKNTQKNCQNKKNKKKRVSTPHLHPPHPPDALMMRRLET